MFYGPIKNAFKFALYAINPVKWDLYRYKKRAKMHES